MPLTIPFDKESSKHYNRIRWEKYRAEKAAREKQAADDLVLQQEAVVSLRHVPGPSPHRAERSLRNALWRVLRKLMDAVEKLPPMKSVATVERFAPVLESLVRSAERVEGWEESPRISLILSAHPERLACTELPASVPEPALPAPSEPKSP
jgi:hypothetical protein